MTKQLEDYQAILKAWREQILKTEKSMDTGVGGWFVELESVESLTQMLANHSESKLLEQAQQLEQSQQHVRELEYHLGNVKKTDPFVCMCGEDYDRHKDFNCDHAFVSSFDYLVVSLATPEDLNDE